MITVTAPFGRAEVTATGNAITGEIVFTQVDHQFAKFPSKNSGIIKIECDDKPKTIQLTASNDNAFSFPIYAELSDESEKVICLKLASENLPEENTSYKWFYTVQY